MIRISVNGLAKFMGASPAGARKVLQDFKYPADPEPAAMRSYYGDAHRGIKAFHKNQQPREWLREQAAKLVDRARQEVDARVSTRLKHNARALMQYEQFFAQRRFEVLPDLKLRLQLGAVDIGVIPDLCVREGGKTKLVKIECRAEQPEEQAIKVITQCLFEAASVALPDLSSSSILYLELARGVEHRGARVGARTRREIEAACETIAAIWPSIPPPTRRRTA